MIELGAEWIFFFLMWNTSRICMSPLHGACANFLCIVPVLVYVLPRKHCRMDLKGASVTQKEEA